jgi:exodeoxyribonuclease VII small subunit
MCRMSERDLPEPPVTPEIAALSFEDALAELEAIVRRLEKGEGKLDEAIQSYERGALLKRHCETKLREAQARVDKIVDRGEGMPATEPASFD